MQLVQESTTNQVKIVIAETLARAFS